jgi:hypothetical protein
MSRSSRQLAMGLTVATVIAVIGSHWVASLLKVKTIAAQAFTIGKPNGNPPAFLAGSSVADYGITWEEISTQTDTEIKVWGISGGSPYEWEQFQKQVPEARTTFIVVSAYDLDEAMICDFRADLVPLRHTIETLRTIHADWKYSKRALSQYPMTWLRTLFPTLGRSRGLMEKLRENVAELIKPSSRTSETLAAVFLAHLVVSKDSNCWSVDFSKRPVVARALAYRALLFLIVCFGATDVTLFIYFQF